MSEPADTLARLAAQMKSRREGILRSWRDIVRADPELTSSTALSRSQFRDHLPAILEGYEQTLVAGEHGVLGKAAAEGHEGSEHGKHRWLQGYALKEVIREWGHLYLLLVSELEEFVARNPEADREAMSTARYALAVLSTEGVSESASEFARMHQAEAAAQVRDLETGLENSRKILREQAMKMREAAHDLRGGLGIVTSAVELLGRADLPASTREQFSSMVQRAVDTQANLLTELMDLARLQAGQETRQIAPFDAAAELARIGSNAQAAALEKGLYLRTEGPASLPVEGDRVKFGRIVQNLLLNALKYTRQGGVTISWGPSRNNDPNRWTLSVEDTGPGFHAGPGGPLAGALKDATDDSLAVEREAAGRPPAPEAPIDTRPDRQRSGEGIGLSITKRLCELLDATLELESHIDKGTVFRVLFPRRYDES
ncbi:MAG TPA: sensor histidine kinase [Thermoanaerobaculia bacterium]|nr:sensor histidine kinase [Thermoanaerobaculia bacterium]